MKFHPISSITLCLLLTACGGGGSSISPVQNHVLPLSAATTTPGGNDTSEPSNNSTPPVAVSPVTPATEPPPADHSMENTAEDNAQTHPPYLNHLVVGSSYINSDNQVDLGFLVDGYHLGIHSTSTTVDGTPALPGYLLWKEQDRVRVDGDNGDEAIETFNFRDAGVVGVHENNPLVNSKYGKVTVYRNQALGDVYLRDPATTHFNYHSFGEARSSQGDKLAYLVVGNQFVPANDFTLQAHYEGISVGSLMNQASIIGAEVLANVHAQLDFGIENKTLTIKVDNPVIWAPSSAGEKPQFQKASDIEGTKLAFEQTLSWITAAAHFSGTGITASLYGPQAEEIAGTFKQPATYLDHPVTYQGAFGTTRIAP